MTCTRKSMDGGWERWESLIATAEFDVKRKPPAWPAAQSYRLTRMLLHISARSHFDAVHSCE